uniref:Post-GPI attachment to proteins factor 3 n=1 Tax=Meloidogyne hapla TaxID=6305 RepID=A0A1I8B718_MELHA
MFIKIRKYLIILFILIIFYFNKINSSIGDISPYFNFCIFKCKDLYDCPEFKYFQFTWWTKEKCFKCRQKCIWNTVEHFRISKKPIPKFNGKWPFIPITIKIKNIYLATIQEPASMFFSLLNAFSFWKMKQKIKKNIQNDWKHFNKWLGFGRIGIITWIASILFHSCDHWITETFDYCAAFSLILYTFYISICFCFPLINSLYFEYFGRKQNILAIGLISFYLAYLKNIYSKPIFNYSFHMKCCILIGLLTGIIFLFWIFFEYLKGKKRFSIKILIITLIISFISASFDAFFDFPPIFWIFDAHSFFHLFSIPIPILWAEFLCLEAKLDKQKIENKMI